MCKLHADCAHQPQTLLQRGLSLIELMVGLTIGLILTLGLFTLIASSSQAFKVQDDFARIQENATAALRYIGDSIRMAGFYGYAVDPTTITINGTLATTNDCGSNNSAGGQFANVPATNWALDLSDAVFGYSGLTPGTVTSVFPCIKSVNFQAGFGANPNPILVTRGGGGIRISTTALAGTTVYLQADPSHGIMFYGADFANLKANGLTRLLPGPTDVDVFEYRPAVYYIRSCSRPAGGGTDCTGPADDNGQPIPTLARQELIGGTMTEVPLVEGIDMISYQFGVDTNSDGYPDFFIATPSKTGATPAQDNYSMVVAVKVSVLARSDTANAEYNDQLKTYDLVGDGTTAVYACTNYAPPACNYKRKVFTRTFQVRNIAQRRGA